ncbi:MATE family efflux transporter [Glaciimonas immobilis]|uniref:Putative MATE family efflux protein n=1 Tax=Glaciimonas immobilis TaxID=728004 RepID=A0A840RQ69_9BURK|nr:MATE family efflux transporter [Glaciimonas immobilis]KAF3999288.1 multidrug transporter MatE [Glaciimonas immobilis]MBB5198761.1 putative MATE family efflux protein [Glaciimonas immobilis]
MQNTSIKSLRKQFIALAIPTLLSGWVYTLYTFVDGIFIGRYLGTQSLAALNLLVPLLYVPYAVSLMIGVGGATLIARLSGQQRFDEARQVFTQALWSMLVIGIGLSVVVLTNTSRIAGWMGASGELAAIVEDYMRGYAWFILFAQTLYALEFFLRTEGTKAATFGLYAMFLGALVNVFLDYYLIVSLTWDMKGAGLATGISMLVSSVTMFGYHVFKAVNIRPCRSAFKQGSYIGKILYNGSSEFLGAIAAVVTVFTFNRLVLNAYGESGLAAYAILEYMTLAATVTMVGFVQSMQPMVSFYRGANQPQAMRVVFYCGTLAVMGVAVVVAAVMVMFSRQLTFLFLPDGGAAWEILAPVVIWYALAFLPAGCNLIAAGYLTAVERPGASAIIAILRSWVLLLGALWLLNAYFGGHAIWYALLITELLTLIASGWLLWRYQHPRKARVGNHMLNHLR